MYAYVYKWLQIIVKVRRAFPTYSNFLSLTITPAARRRRDSLLTLIVLNFHTVYRRFTRRKPTIVGQLLFATAIMLVALLEMVAVATVSKLDRTVSPSYISLYMFKTLNVLESR